MRTLIVTGASGRIGRALQVRLQDTSEIKKIDRNNFNARHIRELIVKAIGEVYLIHLAWPISSLDFKSSSENIDFVKKSIEIFRSLQGLKVKIIAAGSVLEAGNSTLIEDSIINNPQNLYAESKCHLREFLKKEFPLDHIWARVSSQVSFYDQPYRLVGTLLASHKRKVTLYGTNNNIDLIHVSDVALAFHHCISNFHILPSELVIGTGRTIQIARFAEHFFRPNLIEEYLDQPITLNTNPQSLKNSGWSPKYISSDQLYNAIIKEPQIC
jgi:nucleoside-diphosphate-sugar epimerase